MSVEDKNRINANMAEMANRWPDLFKPSTTPIGMTKEQHEVIEYYKGAFQEQQLRASTAEARVKELERQLAEAGEDKARLDWLEQGSRLQQWSDGWQVYRVNKGMGIAFSKTDGHPTARAAIDAARAQEGGAK